MTVALLDVYRAVLMVYGGVVLTENRMVALKVEYLVDN